MIVTEAFYIMGFTVIATDNPDIMRAKAIIADGKEYKRVNAYDIGDRIAINGDVDLLGKKISIVI